jgi:nitrogen fixation-related uncharacterized protein
MTVYMTSDADVDMVKYFFRSTIMTYLKTNAFVGNVNHLLHATYRGPAFANPFKNVIASQGSNGEQENANTEQIWGLSHRVSMLAMIAVSLLFGINVMLTFWWCLGQREYKKLTYRDASRTDASSTSELLEGHNKDSRNFRGSGESRMAFSQMHSNSLSVILEEDGEYEDDSTVGSRSKANTRRYALSQQLDSSWTLVSPHPHYSYDCLETNTRPPANGTTTATAYSSPLLPIHDDIDACSHSFVHRPKKAES